MARMNISVPDHIKDRMDNTAESVNWSSVASDAFLKKLGELAERQKEKNLASVIDRLRATKFERQDSLWHAGYDVGLDWAKHRAEAYELANLAKAWPGMKEDQNRPLTSPIQLAHIVTGTEPEDYDGDIVYDAFWARDVFQRDSQRGDPPIDPSDWGQIHERDWLRGFADAAVDLYNQVVDQL